MKSRGDKRPVGEGVPRAASPNTTPQCVMFSKINHFLSHYDFWTRKPYFCHYSKHLRIFSSARHTVSDPVKNTISPKICFVPSFCTFTILAYRHCLTDKPAGLMLKGSRPTKVAKLSYDKRLASCLIHFYGAQRMVSTLSRGRSNVRVRQLSERRVREVDSRLIELF